ncbi:hypothetical protein MSC49_32090 [Methylosinus sp. C49]|nr:hypothetical protein MSC49_32090 [Methylosinus sp. C49]
MNRLSPITAIGWQRDRYIFDRTHVLAPPVVEPHQNRKAPISFEDHPSALSADGDADDILHFCETQPQTSDFPLVDIDLTKRKTSDLLDLDVFGAVDLSQDRGDLIGGFQPDVEVLRECLDGDIAPRRSCLWWPK